MDALREPCKTFVGAVRHHGYFTGQASALNRIRDFCGRIARDGARAFVDEEYPVGSGKAMIVNEVEGRLCLVDGNAHLVALLVCDPELTLGGLAEAVGRSDFIRLWQGGWEQGSGQEGAYDIYVPLEADVSRIPGSRSGVDGFKQPPEDINVIPPTVPFDSPLFSLCDRGRILAETANSVRRFCRDEG